jgi:hypothetical protein
VLDAIAGVAAIAASAAELFDARWLVETSLDSQLYDALELGDMVVITMRPMPDSANCSLRPLTKADR